MSFTVFMPDYSQVNLIKRSFYNDPQYIYTVLLAALTGNREMIKDSLDKLIAK
jgi:tryptophan synthase alpha subunit